MASVGRQLIVEGKWIKEVGLWNLIKQVRIVAKLVREECQPTRRQI